MPIVVAICAVMVLPGGTFVASGAHPGNPMAASAGITTAVSGASAPSGLQSVLPSSATTASYGASVKSPSSTSASPAASTYTTSSNGRPTVSSLPAYLDNTPWAQALLHPTSSVLPTVSLPNLQLLQNGGVKPVDGQISPYYTAQPAPLGLTDYGLGAQTYAYNTSHVAGTVTFNAPPNVTQPGGAVPFVEPSLGGQHEGALGSAYEFGIQLNTVGINLTIPGTDDQGYVWAQNVVNWNDSGIHFVMDTWNASHDSYFYMAQNSIYSACDNNTAGVNYILQVYGGVLQCVKGTIPITAADYPVTISLYNNFTTNAQNRTALVYGYSITEAGVGVTLSGIADTVVFNNTAGGWANPTAPPNLPGNTIDGFHGGPDICPTCGGITADSEIDIVGGIGGDNAVFRSINGSVTLQYSNESSGGWKNVPSAYNFGGDTGETSTGIADYYTTGHVLEINQGPAMLYGLWNAEPQVSVGPGDVHIGGTISPSYGFVFVSNTPPVLNPWNGVDRDNMSYLPTNDEGAFSTYLPAFGGTWTSTYYVQAFAAGSKEYNGTVTASTSTLAISLTAAPGELRAPLYMYTNAQASALAAAVGGASTSPYTFNGLSVDMNFTFNHLNDYDYPSFEVFLAQGVGNPVYVNNTYQGTDSAVSGNSYIGDNIGSGGILVPAPGVYTDIPYYSSGINIYNGNADHVTNQELFSEYGQGSQIVLWQDSNVWVNDTISIDGGPGVWVGESVDTQVDNTLALDATGVTDVGSTGTSIWNLTAEEALGVEALSSHDLTVNYLNATIFSEGISSGDDEEVGNYYNLPGTDTLTVNFLNVTYDSLGANLTFSSDITLNSVAVFDDIFGEAYGLELDGTDGTSITSLVANWGGAIYTWNATDTTINGLLIENESEFYENANFYGSTGITITDLVVDDAWDAEYGYGVAIWGGDDSDVTITDATVFDQYGGFVFDTSTDLTATNLNSSYSEFPYQFGYFSSDITVTNVNAFEDYIGCNIYESTDASVTNAVINDSSSGTPAYSGGVTFYDSTGGSITNVAVTNDSWGARLDYGTSGVTVSDVTVATDSTGVYLYSATYDTVKDVTAAPDTTGVFADPSNEVAISDVTVSGDSIGVAVLGTDDMTISGVTATDGAIAVVAEGADWTAISSVTVSDLSVGVFSVGSEWTYVSGVTATNTTTSSPWTSDNVFGLPGISAVETLDDGLDAISDVVATHYPAAYYDIDSYDPGVTNVNATDSYFAIVLNDTEYGTFTDIGAFQDWQGMALSDGSAYNVITQSSFVDCTSYAIAIYYGYYNLVYENNFIANNGATNVYNSAHIQAYSGYGNYNFFDASEVLGLDEGNYWSDWHTYNPYGELAPYPIGDGNFDYYPLGGPEGTVAVYFYEDGLASGVTWSVTLNGATQSTANDWLVFYAYPGTYSWSAGAVTGYAVAPASGSVVAAGGYVDEYLTYTAQYAVNVTESGLQTGTSWTAIVGGVSVTGTTPTLTVTLGSGTYAYQITPVAGYSASPSSGTLTVALANYNLLVTFTQVTYAVTVTEAGLSSGTSWSATVGGHTQASTGTSITFYLPNGTYAVSVANVSGYSVSGATGSVTVNGASAGYSVTFTSTTSSSVVSSSTFNTWLAVAIAIAVIALVLGLLAVFLRRRRETPPSGGAPPS